jgi:flavin reductase (DIM6/NTAB) family NADH-FMN oxidoreductase RutF
MTVDPKAFRNALGCFPTGVAIVTALDAAGAPVGLTCNSFSSVSLEPPLVSWGLRLNSKNLDAFKQASAFTINVLADHQKELSGRFASSSTPAAEKFATAAWKPGRAGVPVIDDCVAVFECTKFAEQLAGDHLLLLGEVVAFEQRRQDDSLVFYKGAYMMLTQTLRELVDRRMQAPEVHEARRLVNCMLLRLAAVNGSPADFDAIARNIAEIESLQRAEDGHRRLDASLEFFGLISRAAHNEVLVVVSESLATVLRQIVRAAGSSLSFRSELEPVRRRILERLRARDPDGAEREMADYFEQIRGGGAAS